MAFIPIDAKADLQGQKKGKMTPAQHAILNAWSLSNKTGILDFPQDHTKQGRCEATALQITNIQNYTTEITFYKGYIVICGRLVECESNTKFTFKTPTTGTETGKIIARFSLGSSGNEEFMIAQKTGALIQNDLNENAVNGVYEFELYSYEATPTTVKLTRTQPYIPDIGGKLSQFEASLKDEGKPLHGYDDAKGTIEERLTALGFKKGSVILSSNITATKNEVVRQGNYVLGKFDFSVSGAHDYANAEYGRTISLNVGTLPENFRPKENINVGVRYEHPISNYDTSPSPIRAVINTNGIITVTWWTQYTNSNYYNLRKGSIVFGFEAKAL